MGILLDTNLNVLKTNGVTHKILLRNVHVIDAIKEAFPEHYCLVREKAQTVNIIDLSAISKFVRMNLSDKTHAYVLRVKNPSSGALGTDFLIRQDQYDEILETLRAHNRYDILIKLEV